MKKTEIFRLTVLLLYLIMYSCDQEEKVFPPHVDTASVDEITNTSARIGGRISDNGGAEITERGVYWSTSGKPEISGTKRQIGSGTGIYYDVLSGLSSGTKYYVTAYAVNCSGTSYGSETFFTTQISLPSITTSPVTEYTSTTALLGGNITDDGGFEINQRGIFWGTEPDPVLTGTKIIMGKGAGEFSQVLTGLTRTFTYYFVAFATNIKGTSYGDEISFSTEPEMATVITAPVADIDGYSAKIGGTVSSDGGSEVTERGLFWGQMPDPVTAGVKLIIGNGTGAFSTVLSALNPAETYYIKAYAVNSKGTSYGDVKSFKTLGEKPEITMLDSSDLGRTGIVLNLVVAACDLSISVSVEYGFSTSYGTTTDPVILQPSFKDTTISIQLSGLLPLTTYHYLVTAENDLGPAISNDRIFRTVNTGITGSVTDSQGNTYNTIWIGYHEWMTENLKTILYRNGTDSIPLVENDSVWISLTSPAYCWYENKKTEYGDTYGALYNWHAIATGNLCPAGWHVAAKEDIEDLVNSVGGADSAAINLKEAGTDHWKTPNEGASDKYGFKALPGGKRFSDGIFDLVSVEGNWWSSSEYSTLNSYYLNFMFNYPNAFQAFYNKRTGMSVRCVRD